MASIGTKLTLDGITISTEREGGTTMSHEWEVVQANLFLKVKVTLLHPIWFVHQERR